MLDKDVLTTYKAFNPVTGETCNGLSYIVGEGKVKLELDKEEVTIT